MNLESDNWWVCSSVALVVSIVMLAAAQHALADCQPFMKLEGAVSLEACTPGEKGCIPASRAMYEYTKSAKVDRSVHSVFMHASPWHLYDGDMRILTIEELAGIVKPQLKDSVKRIVLIASWTGVAPEPNGKSIAQKLSDFLDGFPVTGMDGFVWMAKDGAVRTTRQAFTVKRSKYPYLVHPGDEVMASFVEGWSIHYEEDFAKQGYAEGVMGAGVGWDIFGLCPDRALQSFEAAAKLSNSIAAYNAAMIRIERGKEGDIEAAKELLSQAAALGDKKANTQLQKLTRQGL